MSNMIPVPAERGSPIREKKLPGGTSQERQVADTIFLSIIDGTIPCHRVYEDDHVLAFLDINPISVGHTIVIPKELAETLGDLSDESAEAVGRVLPRLCRAVREVTGVRAYNILQNNGSGAHQAVMHVHFHIIPKPDATRGLGVGWPAVDIDHQEGAQLAGRLRSALEADV